MKALGREHCGYYIVAGHAHEGSEQWHDHSAIAELRTRLDHLRQPHFSALGGVKRLKRRADNNAHDTRQDRVSQRQAETGSNEADRDRKELKVAEKPEQALVPDASMALVLGNEVYRMRFNAEQWLGQRRRGLNQSDLPRSN